MGYKIDEESLKDMINKVWKSKSRQAIKKILEAHEPNSVKDYVEAFVIEFGRGDERKVTLTAEMADVDREKLEN